MSAQTTEKRERKQALQLNLEAYQVRALDAAAAERRVPVSEVAREVFEWWCRERAGK
jgi:hypothetical protein